MSVCRGGRRLAKSRHNLGAAGLTEDQWREQWKAKRLLICADGDAAQVLGNLTVRFHPDGRWLELRLPRPLEHLANRPHGRYRLSCPVVFCYRGDDVAAQVMSGAVRYDITFDPARGRWYLDASWTSAARDTSGLDELRSSRVLGVDLNDGHLAACVLDPSGNPAGRPFTVELAVAGLAATARDGHLRAAVTELIAAAHAAGCKAIVIENLGFDAARELGAEYTGRRPSRGRRGRNYRRMVAGIPTAGFRSRLTQMATNAELAVVAVDPAYTTRWGAEHWLATIRQISPTASGHHAAALVVARRGLGQRARRRERCDPTRPEDRGRRATNSAVQPTSAPAGLTEPADTKPGNREAAGQPHTRRKTRPGGRPPPATSLAKTVRARPRKRMSYSLPR